MFENLYENRLRTAAGIAVAAGALAVSGCGGDKQTETVTVTEPAPSATKPLDTKPLLPGSRHKEIEQFGANTFASYLNASGEGPHLEIGQAVVVDCLATGPEAAAPSVHGRWYHLIDPETYSGYFVAANTFENGNPNDMTLAVDPKVPPCPTK
jgi:hypothetical protein